MYGCCDFGKERREERMRGDEEGMTKCAITCQEPGCTNRIFYDDETDTEVPLYCNTHRSSEGRHSATKQIGTRSNIIEKTTKSGPSQSVIMICPKCKRRKLIPTSLWKQNPLGISCPNTDCKTRMNYHKDATGDCFI